MPVWASYSTFCSKLIDSVMMACVIVLSLFQAEGNGDCFDSVSVCVCVGGDVGVCVRACVRVCVCE